MKFSVVPIQRPTACQLSHPESPLRPHHFIHVNMMSSHARPIHFFSVDEARVVMVYFWM